ncbi:uncharacterized protein LOC125959392 [Anopheles darlingi]|uniref:uncharacterized protein LOC125959392 n=1 Tax=Anopheles darlingi TaxID=43151 RepID=UPI0021002706|nr:uncharacterized protein LOC125959392 [Anopheles darlingi]
MPDLATTSRWFRGPQFLWESVKTWPAQPAEKPVTGSELRPAFADHHSSDAPSIQQPVVAVTRFSDWAKVLVVTGRVLRFVHNCRASSTQRVGSSGPITAEERSKAQRVIISQAQREAFPAEIDLLKNAKTSTRRTTVIPKQSPIHSLSPYLDECGILRMRTRIAACHYATEDAKRPVILPRRHPVTELIVRKFHERFHHRNHETVINEVRQLYHIPHLRSCYARVRRNCQWCKNAAAEPKAPIMADLPPARLAAYVRPFTYVGLDYFGPIEVAVGRRVEKRWGMLATCLTVRAVHIEVVHSLTTSSCIMGLRNLIARRGTPLTIFCDRGTNFVGAQRELQRNPELIDHVDITKECSQRGIRWEFNPQQASHMGGSWERLIRTVKENIVAASSAKRLNDEVLRSLLVEVESIMNARPLTHVPVDDDSAPALTPNHFLLGSSNGMKQPGELDDSGSLLRQNWRTSQALANRFWRRWLTDYLPEITRRTKWHRYNEPIRTGDVVVIVDPRLPRNSWPKGVVEQVFASKQDGQTPPNVISTTFSTGDTELQYGAILSITNASAATVGRYYCVSSEKEEEDLDVMVIEEFASSIYVFVKDYNHPLVPTPALINYIYNADIFIPCKPSYQDIEVELCTKFGECSRSVPSSTKGFAISKVTLKIPEDGQLICRCDNSSFTIFMIPIDGPTSVTMRETLQAVDMGTKIRCGNGKDSGMQAKADDGRIA